MSAFSVADHKHMSRAIRLARQGIYSTDPNPRVGCVLTRDGEVIGEGFHQRAGEGHAEVNALRQAGDARGATAYVTLEPCNHFGRTPPCSQGLIDAGVTRVIAAMQDPNPQVGGQGLERLRAAGVQVASGLMEAEARALNPGFLSRMERGRPFIRLKLAMSVDGRTAMASGESKWITGAEARSDVQLLRARSSAIMTGIGSILADDSALTVRESDLKVSLGPRPKGMQPLRIVLDRSLKISPNARALTGEGSALVVSKLDLTEAPDSTRTAFERTGTELWSQSVGPSGYFDLKDLVERLSREKSVNELLVETGAGLAGQFLEAGLVDELWVYMAPKLMGSSARPLAQLPFNQMAESIDLQLADLRQFGSDLRMIYKLEVLS